jgi:hypothetical protein
MLAHTFAGSSWRSLVGLESDRAVFERFRQRRQHERLSLLNTGRDHSATLLSPPPITTSAY